MPHVTLEEAQRRLPELIAAAIPGEEILIVRDDQVIARLVAVPQARSGPRAGSAQGKILHMAEDFDAPLEDFKDYM